MDGEIAMTMFCLLVLRKNYTTVARGDDGGYNKTSKASARFQHANRALRRPTGELLSVGRLARPIHDVLAAHKRGAGSAFCYRLLQGGGGGSELLHIPTPRFTCQLFC
jgi:hypothetical protein